MKSKKDVVDIESISQSDSTSSIRESSYQKLGFLKTVSEKINSFGAETRGIERVENEERIVFTTRSKLSIALLWASGCGSFSASASFFLGPIIYNLSLSHSLSASISGIAIGSIISAFNATMGPKSGLRQMVGSRIFFGWYFSKVCAALSLISVIGFSCCTIVYGGQVLTSLSDGKLPIEVGIVAIGFLGFIVAVFGINFMESYQKIAFLPIVICFILLYICASSGYNASMSSKGDTSTIIGHWLSFFSLSFGTVSGWGAVASDYYTLFEETTSSPTIFLMTWLGICLPTCFVSSCAICIGSGFWSNQSWSISYSSGGTGGLVNEALSRWGAGGKFVFAVLFLSLVSNCVLNIYSLAFAGQVIHPRIQKLPRYFVTLIGFLVALTCALIGRNKLSTILSNFLPMIGYWVTIYFTIIFTETVLYRNKNKFPLNWKDWDTPEKQTKGISAAFSFVCGAAGAVLGMNQAYYTGAIAKIIGSDGADLGLFLSFGFTLVIYSICRFIELKVYKK